MIYIFLILSLFLSSDSFAQTFQVTSQGQHPYRHIPRDLNSGSDNASDEECATYESSSGLFEWQSCSQGDAPSDATYITQTPNTTLTNEQTLSSLASGVLSSTTTTGVVASTAFTAGSIAFGNGTILTQDNTNFFWDDTNNRLGFGTITPSYNIGFGGAAERTIGIERSVTGAGVNFTLTSGGAVSGGADTNGGDFYIRSGQTTGTGTSNVYIQTQNTSPVSADDNTYVNAFKTVGGTQQILGVDMFRIDSDYGGTGHKRVSVLSENVWTNASALPAFNIDGVMLFRDSTNTNHRGNFLMESSRLNVDVYDDGAGQYLGQLWTAQYIQFMVGTAGTTNGMYISNTGRVGLGTTSPVSKLQLSGSGTHAFTTSPLTNGAWFDSNAWTVDDQSATGTKSTMVFHSFHGGTYASTLNAKTVTDAANVYIEGEPSAGTGATITNSWALWVDAGIARIDDTLQVPTLRGSNVSGGDLTLYSTSHATKGNIFFGTSTYDEVNNRLGVGTASPVTTLHILGDTTTEGNITFPDFASANIRYITIDDQAIVNGVGNAFAVVSGKGNGTGNGGSFTLNSGKGGVTGNGGLLTMAAGNGGDTSGNGGHAEFSAGNASTSGNGGTLYFYGGNGVGTNKNGGNVEFWAGIKTGSGIAGSYLFYEPIGGFYGELVFDNITANRTYTFPNNSGTLAFNPMTTAGDIIYGGTAGVETRLAAGTATQVLHSGTIPSWSAVSLTADVSGTLPIANGGTGATTLTGILLGNGTSAITAITTSSGIASAISDETGTGALVFAVAPTFRTSSPQLIGTSAIGYDTEIYQSGTGGGGQNVFKRADGTEATPTDVLSGMALGSLSFRGYVNGGFSGSKAYITAETNQNWTSTANGTRIIFSTTPNGSTTLTGAMQIHSDQGVGTAAWLRVGDHDTAPTNTTAGDLTAVRAFIPTLYGSSANGGDLTLYSTSHVVKGNIFFGTSTYDEVNNRLGIANTNPAEAVEITGNLLFTEGADRTIRIENTSDTNADDLIIQGAQATGEVQIDGHIIIKAAQTGTSGTPGNVYLAGGDNSTNGKVILGHNGTSAIGTVESASAFSVTPTTGNSFIVDTSVLVADATNARVGIGTASPQRQLHVYGTGNQRILVESTNSQAEFNFTNAAGTWAIYNQTDGDFYFYNGANRVRFTAAGMLRVLDSATIGSLTATVGTSGAKNLVFVNGTAPSSSPADQTALWAQDTVAGQSNLYARNENGKSEQLTGLRDSVSSQFDATADTVTDNITGLSINVEASKEYAFRAVLFTTSNVAAGVKVAMSGTATATLARYEVFITDAGVTTQGRAAALDADVGVTAVTAALVKIEGVIVVNAAGTLTVQFAQNASNAAASSVLTGSYFEVIPIGD